MLNYGIRFLASIVLVNMMFLSAVAGAGFTVAQSKTQSTTGSSPGKKLKLVNLWQPGDPGQRMNIRGRLTSIDGTAIAGASIVIRQADGNGDYHEGRYNATIESGQNGSYQFASVLPGQYYGVKHIHVWVSHEAYESLDTRIVFKGDQYLDESTTPEAVFLEESIVNGETILFGRFDIVMTPR